MEKLTLSTLLMLLMLGAVIQSSQALKCHLCVGECTDSTSTTCNTGDLCINVTYRDRDHHTLTRRDCAKRSGLNINPGRCRKDSYSTFGDRTMYNNSDVCVCDEELCNGSGRGTSGSVLIASSFVAATLLAYASYLY